MPKIKKRVELKDIRTASPYQINTDLLAAGYNYPNDYEYDLAVFHTNIYSSDSSLYVLIYNDKMLKDPRVREIFLEHLI